MNEDAANTHAGRGGRHTPAIGCIRTTTKIRRRVSPIDDAGELEGGQVGRMGRSRLALPLPRGGGDAAALDAEAEDIAHDGMRPSAERV